ncbi:hypothetical protein ACFQ51_41955 [Streptomyces kaempferi]
MHSRTIGSHLPDGRDLLDRPHLLDRRPRIRGGVTADSVTPGAR